MFGKLLTVFLAIIALQGISSFEHDIEKAAIERGLVEDFQKAISNLKAAIEKAIANAFEKLDDLFRQIMELAENIIQSVTGAIKSAMEKITQEINELKEKARELKIDISECLGENEKALQAIPEKLVENTRECVSKEIEKAKQIVEDTKSEISKARNIIDELLEKFKKCSGISSIPCMLGVIGETSKQLISIPLGILKQVAAAGKLVATAKTNLVVCETKNIAEATGDAFKLSGVITKCIIDKIGEGQ